MLRSSVATALALCALIGGQAVGVLPPAVAAQPDSHDAGASTASQSVDLAPALGAGGEFQGVKDVAGTIDLSGWTLTSDLEKGEPPRFAQVPSVSVTPNAWSALGSNGAADGALNADVYALAVSGSDLYAGGSFTNAAGIAKADYIAKWDGSAWSALGDSLNDGSGTNGALGNYVDALAVSGSDLYVGGGFNNAAGIPQADRVAKWDGSTWSALGSNSAGDDGAFFSEVGALAVAGSNLFVAVNTPDAAGIAQADYIIRWTGTGWAALGDDGAGNGAINSQVVTLAVLGTDLYVGGAFTNAGGIAEADYIAKWNGSAWSALGSNGVGNGALGDYVRALAVSGTDLYVGGSFSCAEAPVEKACYLALWSVGTWSALSTDWADVIADPVYALAVAGDDLYVGGLVREVTGMPTADYAVKWDGSAWSALGSNAAGDNGALNEVVYALAVSGDGTSLFVGGQFSDAAGIAAADYIAAWGPGTPSPVATTTSISFDPNPSVYGQAVTFTATVEPATTGSGTPTGTVQFKRGDSDKGAPVALGVDGTAGAEFNDLLIGCDPFSAVYSGDSTFAPSVSTVELQCVEAAATTTTLVSDPDPSALGEAVTFTATVAIESPGGGALGGGTVQFAIDGVDRGDPLDIDTSWQASIIMSDLSAGAHEVTATYSGYSSLYLGSTSDPLTQTVEAPPEPDTTIATGPSGWTNDATPTFTFSSDTPGATFECSDDGGAFLPCTTPHTMAPQSDGEHTCAVRAVNGTTPDGTPASRAFTVDTTLPYTGYAEVEQQLGGQVSSGPIELYWQASDNLTATVDLHHEWQWRKKVSGVWQAWQTGGTVDELDVLSSQPLGKTYQYRIRSVDLAGNWGAWEETEPIKLLPKQETAFTYSTGWIRHTMTGAWGNYVRTRAKVGAWARLSFTGTSVALVMPTGAGQGTVSVCLDPGTAGQQCRTVNLATFSPTGVRRLMTVFGDLALRNHVLKITIVSGTVNLDGAIVGQ